MLAIRIPFYILMPWLCVSPLNFCPIASFFSASRRRCLLSVQVEGAESAGISFSLGVIRGGDCGEILYPNTIRDLIDFSLRECVKQEIPVRRCRNYGRYFPITGRVTAEYCSRPNPSGKLCRSTAPVRKWVESRRSGQVFQEYRREYKRRFAWIKAGKITEEQFTAWHKAAKARKKDCDREVIFLDGFRAWLKDS
jgi:hypothetical protein